MSLVEDMYSGWKAELKRKTGKIAIITAEQCNLENGNRESNAQRSP